MRCHQCSYTSPPDHKFCGMCGTRLQTVASAPSIFDDDPLELEGSDPPSASLLQSAQIARGEQQREASRDPRSINSRDTQRSKHSSVSLEDFPPKSIHREAIEEVQRRSRSDQSSGISGPSFLGLGRDANNPGFVYDNPRDDGFIYDTASETPEYLLAEVSRGVSWRAWALFLLLLIAAGLGYIQWRASRNKGPDIAAVLSGNGAAVGSGGPAMSGNNKPPAPKPEPATKPLKTNEEQASAANSDSSDTKPTADTANTSDTAKESSDSKTVNAKPADSNKPNANPSADKASAATSTKKGSAKDTDEEETSKLDTNRPDSRVTKSSGAKSAPVEDEASPPKPLGEKDPLIIQAEKYIQGRGVRKNCSTGINLLRQAVSAGNPAADVKMGALYWSGTCVTQNKVAAYEWFSRAHSLEPKNRWIERSRNSLWASMSPSEKQRAAY